MNRRDGIRQRGSRPVQSARQAGALVDAGRQFAHQPVIVWTGVIWAGPQHVAGESK